MSGFRVSALLTASFWVDFVRRIAEGAMRSALQIVGVALAYLTLRFVLFRIIEGILSRLAARDAHGGAGAAERVGRLETVQSLCKSLTSYLLFFVFGILLLKAIGLDMMPFITTAGVLGLAVGFGSQKLVKDVISGFFIFIDNLFVIGETVTVNGITGQVHEMGTRVTRLLDSSGRLYLIPNGDIGTVTNLSRYPVGDFVEFSVAASADLGKVINTVNSVGNALFEAQDTRLQAAPQFIGTTSFTAASITVRVSVVSDPVDLAKEQMRVREELRKALTSAGIALV